MKKFIIGAALATLLASPVFAQSYSSGFGTGNVVDVPAAEKAGSANQNTTAKRYAHVQTHTDTCRQHARSHAETPKG